MRRTKNKKSKVVKPVPRARGVHGAQRQRLIDACISALHIYGPSRTTVEKVVGIAKMSPGIVRFYFASKAAMLVAALQFLAAEFEEQLVIPVSQLKATPVAALEMLVALYLDPEIASPRKVSVWYAFWGEASSRQEYYDICGQKDERFAVMVRELIEAMIREVSLPHLDADGIALGLIGVLEILWQEFAFKTEAEIDRPAALRRCHAFLGSIFPSRFGTSLQVRVRPAMRSGLPSMQRPARWIYDDRALFELERERIFNASWQFAGHLAQAAASTAFFTANLGNERVLVVRDAHGALRAFRNTCSETPHALITERRGELAVFTCEIHGVSFGLNGKRCGGRGSTDLFEFSTRSIGDLLLVRAATPDESTAHLGDDWHSVQIAGDAQMVGVTEWTVAADWKLVVEGLLDVGARDGETWSGRRYRSIIGEWQGRPHWQRFLAPNHWLEVMPDGFRLQQVLPTAPGRSVYRESTFTWCEDYRTGRVARYLAARVSKKARMSGLAVAASTQQGMFIFGDHGVSAPLISQPVAAFRHRLSGVIPALNADSGEVLRGVG